MIKPKADFLIEMAHEVVNPVGGVYTVLTSKAPEMKRYYGGDYFLVGPYCPKYAKVEFEEGKPPVGIKRVFDELKKEGIECHFGTWLIAGRPKTILVEFGSRMKQLKSVKKRIAGEHKIDCKKCGKEYNKRIVMSDSISRMVQMLLEVPPFKGKRGAVHEHISGSPGVFLMDARKKNLDVGLVATAHSTRLGRDIAISNEDIVSEIRNRLKRGQHVGERREYAYGGGVIAEHQLEKACAGAVDVFTAVSDITGRECRYILHRKPDVITTNGIKTDKYPTIEERAYLHRKSKEKIWKFLEAYFLPYYPVDVENSLLLFTSGRYEFHTKGFDVFIRALGRLNKKLKEENYGKSLFVFFFIFDRGRRKQNYDVLENLSRYEQIEEYVQEKFPELEERATSMLVHGDELDKKELFDSEFMLETKKLMGRFKRPEHRRPPLCALRVGRNDVIFNSLKSEELMNKEEDRVKVIVYPTRISVGDGLLSMDYYDVIAGMHLGVFPSYYEPWGYTPLEAAAYSVLSITTDLAGFGKFVKKNTDQRRKPGILVLRRDGRTDDQVVDELERELHWFSKLVRKKRVNKKLKAKAISEMADWGNFVENYIQAHNMAIEKCGERVG